ncbi:MAG: SDR family NAD(P)-dependent oxidoreductase, partial [Rhodobacteraceae bacterium]|nr:SDR family NAD(P)-dependent oxidoreductase [Paracoccaceae bacterium]
MADGRVAIVTGGTRGIGRDICIALKNKSYKVAANYGGNDEAAKAFTAETGIKAYKWDCGSFDACQNGVAQVVKDLGPVEVLVNNAGITRDNLMLRMTEEQWDQVINTNLKSIFNLTKHILRPMLKAKGGSIINISSIVGVGGNAGQANY